MPPGRGVSTKRLQAAHATRRQTHGLEPVAVQSYSAMAPSVLRKTEYCHGSSSAAAPVRQRGCGGRLTRHVVLRICVLRIRAWLVVSTHLGE